MIAKLESPPITSGVQSDIIDRLNDVIEAVNAQNRLFGWYQHIEVLPRPGQGHYEGEPELSVPEAEPPEQELTLDQTIDNLIGAVRAVYDGRYTQGAINKGRADIIAAAHREYAQPGKIYGNNIPPDAPPGLQVNVAAQPGKGV